MPIITGLNYVNSVKTYYTVNIFNLHYSFSLLDEHFFFFLLTSNCQLTVNVLFLQLTENEYITNIFSPLLQFLENWEDFDGYPSI